MNTLDISKLDTIQRVHTQLFVHYRHILENTPDWSFRKRELSRDYLIEFCKLAVLRILKNELSRDKM